MIHLIEDEYWKLALEEENQKYRFKITHKDSMEITTAFMELDQKMLLITQKVLKEIAKEIEKGKTKSKYESFELFEDIQGSFLFTIDLETYHNFALTFINYPADFQMDFVGHSFELLRLRDAVNHILEEQSFYT